MEKAFDRRAIPQGASEGTWLAADGWALRRLDWAAQQSPARGSILFLGGRADFYEKYLEALSHWHDAGWHLTTFDWRGQGGSGRLGNDPVTGHVDDFSIWIDDLAAFWTSWSAATPGPHAIIAHSMGGHLALRALAERQIDPAAVVLAAPMLGLVAGVLPDRAMHALARLVGRLRGKASPAWKWSERPGEPPTARGALLTHDPVRYQDELWWRAQRPHVVNGPGSWGWLAAAYASMRKLSTPGLLESITTPVLVLAAKADKLVRFAAVESASRRLPHGQLIVFGTEAAHEILREADAVQTKALGAIDAFLARQAPGPAA